MKLRTALPSGLTNKMCERFDPTRMGGAPPIRFVPLSTSASQKKEDGEEDMLDMAFEPKQNSRLSCQILVSDELDGLTVSIPSKQG